MRARIAPALEAGFRDNQFELVAWMEVGDIHFFSTRPLTSLDEMASRRIWQWQGDRFIAAFLDANGWSPVALPIAEVYPALSTGLLDTVASTPLASIALQWAGKTPYMGTQPMATGIGALVLSRRFVSGLPPDLQKLIQRSGEALSRRLIADTRRDDRAALALLRGRTQPLAALEKIDPGEQAARSRKTVAALEARGYLSAEIDRQVDDALARHRAGAR